MRISHSAFQDPAVGETLHALGSTVDDILEP